ncbi:MAG: FliG C-terminal domain-containing protein [Elusimicrobiota bacterium]
MLRLRNLLIACFCLLPALAGEAYAASASPSQTIETKIALEASLEKRLLTVLQKALGTDDVIVIVKAELYSAEELEDELMPGVPAPNTPTTGGIAMTMLKSLSAVVIVEHNTPPKDLELIERTANDILGLDKARGDRFLIEKLRMRREAGAEGAAAAAGAFRDSAWGGDLLRPQTIISILWLLSALCGMLLAYISFARPIIRLASEALTHWSTAKHEPPPSGTEIPRLAAAAVEAPKLANGAKTSNGNGHAHGAEREKLPFGFVSEKNLPMLAHLMRRMTPRTTAVITHYLPPRLAAQILVGLKIDKRREVIRYMSRVTQLEETEVKAVEANVFKKINYLMGGEDKLAAILEEVPAGMQEELISALASKDPDLGRRLGRRLVTLEDLALLGGDDLKTLSRSVQLKSIAAVLKGNQDLQGRLLPKLTAGLGQWLTQEIELSQDLPPGMLAAEQKTVLSALTRLVRDGEIILRRDDADAGTPVAAVMDDEELEGTDTDEEVDESWLHAASEPERSPAAAPPAPKARPRPRPAARQEPPADDFDIDDDEPLDSEPGIRPRRFEQPEDGSAP